MNGYHSMPEKIVKTVKLHFCWGCGIPFEKGSLMLKQCGVWENDGWWNGYFCERCASFIKTKSSFDWMYVDEGLYQGELTNYHDYLTHEITPLKELKLT